MSLHIQVALANFNTKGEDVVVNTWCVDGPTNALSPGEYDAIGAAFVGFYDDAPVGQDSLSERLSGTIVRNQSLHRIKAWNLDAGTGAPVITPLGSPDHDDLFSLTVAPMSTQNLPNEVACVLSLEAVGHDQAAVEVGNTRPQKRRKGRIYLGPFNAFAISSTTNVEARPATGLITGVLAAVADLRDALAAIDPTLKLGLWSRTDDATFELQAVSIDDSFDVIRSRSMDPTAKTRVLL